LPALERGNPADRGVDRFLPWLRRAIAVNPWPWLLPALLMACGDGPAQGSGDTPASVTAMGGDGQVGPAMFTLPESLVVRVANADGEPQSGVTVTWAVENRQAIVTPATSVTDADGIARAAWRLGVDEGEQRAVASVATLAGGRFTATARSGDVREAGGSATMQCGRYVDDVVRCWQPPDVGGGRAVALDTELRFVTLAFAGEEWCGITRDRLFACFRERDLMPGGAFRPDAAPVQGRFTGMPELTGLVGAAPLEEPPTWCGIGTDGAVWCWGDNRAGQIGDGTIGTAREAPTAPVPGLVAVQVAVGGRAVCALASDRAVHCWGDASRGAVAGAPGVSAVPVPTPLPTTERFRAIAATSSGTFCGISLALQGWCWGAAVDGALGRNGVGDTATPVPVEGTEVYADITASGDGFLALTVDRDLVTWGGLGAVRSSATPFRVLRGLLFTELLRGGGTGAVCLRAVPGGARCLDRRTVVAGPDDPPRLHGVPGG
jgi:hypothetical protein